MSAAAPDDALLRRLAGFTADVDRETVERVEDVEGGIALLSPGIPLVWSANYLLFEGAAPGPERMAAIADDVLGGAGFGHRSVSIADPRAAAEAEPAFLELGWEVDRSLFMVLRGSPDRPAPEAIVRSGEVPADLRRRLLLEDDFLRKQSGPLEETAEQLVRWEQRQADAWEDT